ncbi:MAG: thiolase domain-containing protein [Anaerolineales bacterium]|nr:thiolase domain-containing protein [Anaerolineales bacterium]MCX7608416.1 thiolase domain-containing protein [Anaerolineales bacterium]MDW8227477.1 thiolase domain-containing protein [Anaerolineales bacterium]
MTDVIIAGIGQTPVGEHWETSLRNLARQAIEQALDDARGLKPTALFAANVLAPNLSRQAHVGTLLTDFAGLNGIEAATFEAGGASGGTALRQAYLAVKSGLVDVALVVGVEKFTDGIGSDVETATATLGDADYESIHGLTPTVQAALLAQRYHYEYDLPLDGLAGFALVAHAHGASNPNAMYRKAISLEAYQKAETVCDPLNLFDLAPYADGAAALVLTRRELLPRNFDRPLTRIAASASASDTFALHDRSDPLEFRAVRLSVEEALRKASLEREQIDLFEYFDAFSIYAALSLEAAGFARRGEGWKLAATGQIGIKGRIPCATMGGLKARGNPLGATGLYQAVEAVLQLRGEAGANQVAEARIAMIQSLAGPATLAVTHVLERL